MIAATPKRIAFVSHTGTVSGAERSLLDLVEGFDRERFDIEVWTPAAGDLESRVQALGIPTRRLHPVAVAYRGGFVSMATGLATVWASARSIARLMRLWRPDLVHANSLRAGLAISLASRTGPPVIWHVRDFIPAHRVNRLIGWLGRSPRFHWVANSHAVARGLAPITNRPVRVIHNGVRTERFAPGAARPWPRNPPDAYPVVGIVGQIIPWKGQLGVIDAFAALVDEHPGARLWILGAPLFRAESSHYEAQLHRRVQELGLADRVVFWGQQEDVPGALASMDMLVVNSVAEPFGRVVVEAQAAGVAVVATRAGGIGELVEHGRTGWLVPPGDRDALVAALIQLTQDTGLRGRLASAGRYDALSRFTQQAMAQAMMTAMAEAIAGSRDRY